MKMSRLAQDRSRLRKNGSAYRCASKRQAMRQQIDGRPFCRVPPKKRRTVAAHVNANKLKKIKVPSLTHAARILFSVLFFFASYKKRDVLSQTIASEISIRRSKDAEACRSFAVRKRRRSDFESENPARFCTKELRST